MLEPKTVTSILSSKTENIFIAYSGGMDSHVLLHLASLITQIKSKITAVYVHHGLQIEADQWANHCEVVALALDVNFQCLTVNAQKKAGQSQEEVARDARYGALKPLLGEHDVLLVAQHREDQLETVLLQLFRGAGVQGLSGMPLISDFGVGKKCRPFLDIAKQTIIDYAGQHKLSWIEDPSNQCNDFDRNFLRNRIIPELKQRWMGLDKTVSRTARHCAISHHQIEDLAQQLFSKVFNDTDQTLNITRLLELESDKQHLVIRQWFKQNKLRMPTGKNVRVIINEVVLAKENANPEIKIQKHSIRRYRKNLYCLKEEYELVREGDVWVKNLMEWKLNDRQSLVLFETSEGIPKKLWDNSDVTIKFRQGTEKIKLPGRQGRHSLKKLFQEKAIPPWERNQLPLIYINGNLAAIADLWISADFYSTDEHMCYILKSSQYSS
jgi:tRNA(Ile)-lysidine synthase